MELPVITDILTGVEVDIQGYLCHWAGIFPEGRSQVTRISMDVHRNTSQYLGYYNLSPFSSSMYLVVIYSFECNLSFFEIP